MRIASTISGLRRAVMMGGSYAKGVVYIVTQTCGRPHLCAYLAAHLATLTRPACAHLCPRAGVERTQGAGGSDLHCDCGVCGMTD